MNNRRYLTYTRPALRSSLFAALLMLFTLALAPTNVRAATFDVACGDVDSLIAAINAANANDEAETINLTANCTYTLTQVNNPGTFGANGLPIFETEVTLLGNGATIERSSEESTPDFHIVEVGSTGNVTLDTVTIRNGRLPTRSDNFGSGILNQGELTLRNSTVSHNNGGSNGGGIFNFYGDLEVINSTISHNTSAQAGGIFNAGDLDIVNSTISHNSASGSGAIYTESGTLSLIQSTISHNDVPQTQVGGVNLSVSNPFTMVGSVIANNAGRDCRQTDFSPGPINDNGYNFVGDGGCISNPTSRSGDALLDDLADNGGPTLTHLPLTGSPLLDTIDDPMACTTNTDQRGIVRPQGTACDIGAAEVEVEGIDADLVYDVTTTWLDAPEPAFQAWITITNNQDEPIEDWVLTFDSPHTIYDIWNAEIVLHEDDHYVIRHMHWNEDIPAQGSINLGFNALANGELKTPTNCTLNGLPCTFSE